MDYYHSNEGEITVAGQTLVSKYIFSEFQQTPPRPLWSLQISSYLCSLRGCYSLLPACYLPFTLGSCFPGLLHPHSPSFPGPSSVTAKHPLLLKLNQIAFYELQTEEIPTAHFCSTCSFISENSKCPQSGHKSSDTAYDLHSWWCDTI